MTRQSQNSYLLIKIEFGKTIFTKVYIVARKLAMILFRNILPNKRWVIGYNFHNMEI